ncbi:helix-turn-helix domain-containing protein, partial [Arthrobacter rhombi]|uniref:helix-turn-helix domain-containing protein n=1 Tax=Arthrobacter rhombi TaxID=71253 RepID=UPI003FD3DF2F
MDRDPGSSTDITDQRGRVVASIEKVQNSVTSDMVSQTVALYESGASAREIAEEFNVHRQTVA